MPKNERQYYDTNWFVNQYDQYQWECVCEINYDNLSYEDIYGEQYDLEYDTFDVDIYNEAMFDQYDSSDLDYEIEEEHKQF